MDDVGGDNVISASEFGDGGGDDGGVDGGGVLMVVLMAVVS